MKKNSVFIKLYLVLLSLLTIICIIAGTLVHLGSTSPALKFIPFAGLISNGSVTTSTQDLDAFDKIDLRVDTASVTICQGDSFHAEVTDSASSGLQLQVSNGTLSVRQSGSHGLFFFSSRHSDSITVYVPENTILSNADIHSDTGKVLLQGLTVGQLTCSLDTGSLSCENVTASSSNLELDTGKCSLTGFSMNSAKTGTDTAGTSQTPGRGLTITADTGSVSVDLLDPADQVYFQLDSDVGSITCNGSSSGKSLHTVGSGSQVPVTIRCDVGSITVKTK